MPAPTGFPALYLYPLNESFVPKHISLLHNQRVKIGRQTNAKTTPGERNGYFDSKVLSRQHAEVWEEGGKIFIKDVKSSNGTFINGERLSPEGLESDPYELKSDDIVEFGIDIVGEDNKTIIHHKVAARVLCILSEQDLQMAARAEQHQMQHSSLHQQQTQQQQQQLPGPAGSAFNFSAATGQQPPPRRPQMSQQGMAGMGGMGGSMRPPGKSGLTFDHILTRLQGELQKSRETGAELHSLTGAMNEIHETLGAGNLPQNPPPNPHTLPSVRPRDPADVPLPNQEQPDPSSSSPPPPDSHPNNADAAPQPSSSPPPPSNTLITELQSQLKETQTSLAAHINRIHVLEGALKEQETMRNEMTMLRDMMDALQRRGSLHPPQSQSQAPPSGSAGSHAPDEDVEMPSGEGEFDEDDVDDSRSVGTAVPHELERVEEEDEEAAMAEEEQEQEQEARRRVDELDAEESGANGQEEEEDEEERRRRRDELGRPRTPEPTGLGMHVKINGHHPETRNRSSTLTGRSNQNSSTMMMIEELNVRVASFTSQLASALELSKGLQKEHREAQEVIKNLELKVEGLEDVVRTSLKQKEEENRAREEEVVAAVPEPEPTPSSSEAPKEEEERASLTSMIMEWKSHVEGQWSSVREEWSQERQRLVKAREEWESKIKGEWERKVREVDTGLERIDQMEKEIIQDREAREKDRIVSSPSGVTAALHGNGDAIKYRGGVGLVTPPSPRSVSSDHEYTSWNSRPSRRRSRSGSAGRKKVRAMRRNSSRGDDTDDTEETLAVDEHLVTLGKDGSSAAGNYEMKREEGNRSLITPESSLIFARDGSNGNKALRGQGLDDGTGSLDSKSNARSGPIPLNNINVQTAVGVLVLSVAAAAVVWRVKPE
ncbi:hypothetical protein V5O48_012477 [Marasmius crinis-equi]|uniref:FHA domain-containing protein n=1 Tax=Marasmius crinis-equi TaxID=585013 RepID=A0ABR3F2Q8_9AGAR